MMRFTLAGSSRALIYVAALLAAFVLAGCSGAGGGKKLEYETSASLPPLEVPPDLTALEVSDSYAVPTAGGGRVSASQVGQAGGEIETQSGMMPQFETVTVKRAGQIRWLEVQATPAQLWPKLRDFLQEQGLEIARDDALLGIMETAWAENRAGITTTGLRKYFGKLYDAGTRDKYRVRVEREGEDVTAVYLAHRGAKEAVADEDIIKWEVRPSDPELETEMLRRLMIYLGRDAAAAQAQLDNASDQSSPMRLGETEGRPTLVIEEAFGRAWRRVGVALDRLALVVEDQNRAGGTYYVSYQGDERYERGFLSGLFGGEDKDKLSVGTRYQVQVLDQGSYVEVTAYDAEGMSLPDAVATEVLSRLQEELK
jgi:outer membrane protein assembly factor BamC